MKRMTIKEGQTILNTQEMLRFSGLKPHLLKYYFRKQLINPIVQKGQGTGIRYGYDFFDIILVKCIAEIRAATGGRSLEYMEMCVERIYERLCNGGCDPSDRKFELVFEDDTELAYITLNLYDIWLGAGMYIAGIEAMEND